MTTCPGCGGEQVQRGRWLVCMPCLRRKHEPIRGLGDWPLTEEDTIQVGAASNAPRVLNKRTDTIPPDAIYVGRPTKYGNPFVIGKDGTRQEVIAKYEEWLMGHLPLPREDIEKLRGKDLVCWCAPEPCHADVLLRLANRESS